MPILDELKKLKEKATLKEMSHLVDKVKTAIDENLGSSPQPATTPPAEEDTHSLIAGRLAMILQALETLEKNHSELTKVIASMHQDIEGVKQLYSKHQKTTEKKTTGSTLEVEPKDNI